MSKKVYEIAEILTEFHIESETESEEEMEMEKEKANFTYTVLSIDIGVLHLGISVTNLDKDFNIIEIIWIDLINIKRFVHKWGPSKKQCTLYHTKTFCDWLNHTFQENIDFFEKADYILVERQPPTGLVVVEQLILARWRDKTILVHPRSMHSYFNIGKFDYEQRKVYTEKIARIYIKDPALLEQLGYYDRAHDIADSICLMLFWANKKREECKNEKMRKEDMERRKYFEQNKNKMSIEEWFEYHKYKLV